MQMPSSQLTHLPPRIQSATQSPLQARFTYTQRNNNTGNSPKW